VWRFSGSRLLSAHAERRAQRLVAVQFFLLAPYVAIEALRGLIGGLILTSAGSVSVWRQPAS
jgi:hypothetical protein